MMQSENDKFNSSIGYIYIDVNKSCFSKKLQITVTSNKAIRS